MAPPSNRTVSLVVEAGVTGEGDIRKLADEVRRLAREGGDAAPEFQALATQLDRLGDQAGALASFKELAAQVEALSAAQSEAAKTLQGLGDRYDEAKAKVKPLRDEQARLAEAVREAEVRVVQARGALDTYVAGFTRASRDTLEFVQRQAQLREALANARTSLTEQKQELERLAPGLSAAAAEERKLGQQYEAAQGKLEAANEAVRRRTQALRESEAAVLAAGASSADLAASESAILEATQRAAAATQALTTEREQATTVAAELAALDAQNAQALERQQAALIKTVEAFEAEQLAATRAAAALAEKAAAERAAADAAQQAAAEAAESAAAMQRLEAAARAADKEFLDLTNGLRATEAAALEFTAASERAAASLQGDAQAANQRLAAAERLVASERELTVAGRELANERNKGRAALLAEAQALLQSAAAAREAQAAIGKFTTEARQAGQAIDRAFGAVGIRSIDAIEAEIEQTSQALARLESAARRGALGQDELARAAGAAEVKLARLRAEIQQVQATPGRFEQLSNSINGIITRFAGLGAAIATVGVAVRPVIEATVALDQMRRVLTTVTGSAEVAERQIEFLRRTAQQSGQSFTEIGASYAKFAASALQSGLSLTQVNDVFKSVSLAAGNLGLSSDQAKRALEALSQIASKGVVSMEELRQQLGDALPGVLPLLAKELGLTQAELNKVVESGQLLAREAIPAIARSLSALQPATGTVSGLVAEWNRFKNVVSEAGTALAEGPLGQATAALLQAFAGVIRDVSVVVVSASEGISVLGKTIGATAAFVANGAKDFDSYKATISGFAEQAGANIEKFKTTAYGATEATNTLAAAASKAGESFAKQALESQKLIDAAELRTRVSEKLAQATEKEAEAVEQLAGLIGNEVEQAQRLADSAQRVAQAREVAAKAAQGEADALRAAKQSALDKAAGDAQALEGLKAYIEALDKKIAKADADATQADALAQKTRAVADAAALAAQKIGDQSGSLAELEAAVDGAQRAYDAVVRSFQRGKATLDEVEAADRALVKAKNLLRDAVDDLDRALKRSLDTLKADLELKRASLQLDLERARNDLRKAQDLGNETAARQALIRVKEIEQALDKTAIAGKLQEAEATLKYVDATERELRALGQLTPEKAAELELMRKRALAQVLEAQATREANQAKDEELLRLRGLLPAREAATTSTSRHSDALGTNTGNLTANSRALNDNARATDAAATSRARYNDLLAADPLRLVGGNGLGGISDPGLTGVRQPGTPGAADSQGGLPPIDSFGRLIRNTPNGGITRTATGQLTPPDNSGDWEFVSDSSYAAYQRAASTNLVVAGVGYWRRKSTGGGATLGGAGASGTVGGLSPTGFPRPTPAPTPAPSTPGAITGAERYEVVIRFPDGPRTIYTATASDAEQLVSAMTQLSRLAGGG